MRTGFALAVAALVAFPIACKHKEEVAVPKEEIPREIAVNNLKPLLQQCVEVVCTAPKETLKQSEIRLWDPRTEGLEVHPTKAKPIALSYADITGTRMEKSGSKFYVKLYTTVQRDPNKEHISFVWTSEESARNAAEIFESLRKK